MSGPGAGEQDAGADFEEAGDGAPIEVSEPRARRTPPAAIKYDLGSRSYPFDDDGYLIEVHPVDAIVNFKLGVRQGNLAGDKALGNALQEIRYIGGPRLEAEVRDAISLALAEQLQKKDIEIQKLEIEPNAQTGALFVRIHYVNLRLPQDGRKSDNDRSRQVEIGVIS